MTNLSHYLAAHPEIGPLKRGPVAILNASKQRHLRRLSQRSRSQPEAEGDLEGMSFMDSWNVMDSWNLAWEMVGFGTPHRPKRGMLSIYSETYSDKANVVL